MQALNPQCSKCGKAHERKVGGTPTCAGHRSLKGQPLTPCLRYPERGNDKCRKHGALAAGPGTSRKDAEERNLRNTVAAQMQALGVPIEVNPTDAYMDLIYVSAGMVAFYAERLENVDDRKLTWGTVEHKEDDDGFSSTQRAGANVWLKLYNEERDRLADLTSTAIKIGLEERKVKLAESLGSQLLGHMNKLADIIKGMLVRQGWLEEELDEVWAEVISSAIPQALTTGEEEPSGV